MIKSLITLLSNSILDNKGKVSSSRISSYILLSLIALTSLSYLGIDIYNAIVSKHLYVIPANSVVIFGMLLAHHLMLLGIKKSAEDDKK